MERDPAWDVRGRLAVSCLAIRPVVSAALSPECVGDAGFLNGAVASARRHDKRYGDEWSGDGPQRTGALHSCFGHLFSVLIEVCLV
jgi:hypothetical protein